MSFTNTFRRVATCFYSIAGELMARRYLVRPQAWLSDEVTVYADERFAPPLTVFEADRSPRKTGLLDQRGDEILSVNEADQIGFVRSDG